MDIQAKTKLIAILDDDDSMRTALQGLLKAVGLPAQAFASAEEFLKSGLQHKTACLIADIRMPGMSGLELQAKLNSERCSIPTIFITAHGDAKMRMRPPGIQRAPIRADHRQQSRSGGRARAGRTCGDYGFHSSYPGRNRHW